jgi:hypothetical protein
MSETVIMGSMEIWRHSAHEIQIDKNDEVRTLIEEEIVELEREAAMNQRETGNELELEEAEGQQEGDDGEHEAEHRTEESEIIFGRESGYEDGFLYMPGQGFMALDERGTQEEFDGRMIEFERREETNIQGDQADEVLEQEISDSMCKMYIKSMDLFRLLYLTNGAGMFFPEIRHRREITGYSGHSGI